MAEKVLSIADSITVGELAEVLNLPVTTLIGELFKNGIAATINQRIDFETATIIVEEFSDFQCPACGAAQPTVDKILQTYGDKIAFAYRHFPLPQHTSAVDAALAVEAAGAQGKFWEMNNLLYERQNDWSGAINAKSYFIRYASELDLDVERFESDMADQRHLDNVTQDKKDGEALGVNSTPTFFLNGQRLENIGDLEMEIDNLLKELSVEQE